MAETVTRTLPAPFIEALGQTFADQLTTVAAAPVDTAAFAPTVAAQDPLQTQAATLAASGVGSFQPFLTSAAARGTEAATQLGGVPAAIQAADLRLANVPGAITAAQQGLTDVGTTLTGAAGLTGPTAYQAYTSPFQQDVINTTLAEFDRQRQIEEARQSAAVLGVPGAFGGGREGVLQAEFGARSDANRAALQAGLLQQGFTQAQQLAGQDFSRRLNLAQAQAGLAGQQLGIGQAEQSLAGAALGIGGARQSLAQSLSGVGGFQAGLGAQQQALEQQDIANIGRIGSVQQAQAQATLDAQRIAAREAALEAQQRIGLFGAGIGALTPGAGGQFTFQTQASPSPLATALGVGSTLAGIYGAVRPRSPSTVIQI
jgi:hypothetical protein